MEQITITKGTRADLADIVQLVKDLAAYEKELDKMVCSLSQYQQAFDEGIIQTLIAKNQADQAVGMALFYMTFSTWRGKMMYLEDFYIKPEYRRSGLGERIFNAYISEAKAQGCTMIKWQVLDWNEPAVKFYEKIGATIEKEWWNGKIIF